MKYNEMFGCWVDRYDDYSAFIKKIEWCKEHFGPAQDVIEHNFTWGFMNEHIYIQDEKFATLFILRWN